MWKLCNFTSCKCFFIADDNILWHHEGPFDSTYSLETLSQGCKIGLITYAVPCNGYIFPRFSSFFDIFIYFHEYANKTISYRTRSSIDLSDDSTGSIAKCHNDSLGLKLVNLCIFKDFCHFSLKLINMQIRYFALLTIERKGYDHTLK